jgi:pimeloyl-ACP methyl ester carboxylesterase
MNRDAIARVTLVSRHVLAVAAGLLLLIARPAAAQFKDYSCFSCVHDEVTHSWLIPDHPVFGTARVINGHCADIEFRSPEFMVACDGVESSMFEVRRVLKAGTTCVDLLINPGPVFLDEFGEPVSFPDPDYYGALEIEEQDSKYLRFRYTHPIDPPAEGEMFRTVTIGIAYLQPPAPPRAAEMIIAEALQILVHRPPVVMTHGLWSERGAFKDMEDDFKSTVYDPAMLYRVDYKATNDHPFTTNYRKVEDGIDTVFEQAADAGIAAGKVDLVGHSMGGILSRLYAQSVYYDREVRRIVTCNTPHGGSQMANLLLDDAFPLSDEACDAIAHKTAGTDTCYEGAIQDLKVTSAAVNLLLNDYATYPSLVEVHAVKTLVDLTTLVPALSPALAELGFPTLIFNLLRGCGISWYESVFNGDEHDEIVAATSQGGGLQAAHQSEVPNQGHIGSVANPAVIERVRELLSLPRGAGEFTNGYYNPKVEDYFTPNALCPAVPAPLRQLATETIAVTAPVSGAGVQAGQALDVSVVGSPGVATVILGLSDATGRLFLAEQPGPSPTFEIEVPDDMIGAARLFAIGLTALGTDVVLSDAVTLEVGVSATLTGLAVYPAAAHLKLGGTETLEITGQYDDGVDRDLSDLPGLAFAFAEGHASRSGTSGVTLNERLDDTLTITYQGVVAPEVKIRALPPEQPRVPVKPVRRRLNRK